MNYLILSALLFISLGAFTQNPVATECSETILAQKPGTWKAGQQGFIQNVSTTDLAKEKLVIAAIHKMVNTKYIPKGCELNYSSAFGKHLLAGVNWIADPYYYSMYILPFLCDPNDKSKSYVAIATATTVNIVANAMYWLNTLYAANLEVDDFRGYLKLPNRPVKKDGYYFMGEILLDNNHPVNKIIEYRWLITYNDTLPFSYLTRKEYLLIQIKRLEKTVKDSPGDKEWLSLYRKNIDSYLTKSEAELNQPAICLWNEEQRFEKFVEEGTKGSFIAVKPNLAYFKKNLPKSSPQFFTIAYKISTHDPVFEENMSGIIKAVDFATLKNMLGK